jgi:hypothetical protein
VRRVDARERQENAMNASRIKRLAAAGLAFTISCGVFVSNAAAFTQAYQG